MGGRVVDHFAGNFPACLRKRRSPGEGQQDGKKTRPETTPLLQKQFRDHGSIRSERTVELRSEKQSRACPGIHNTFSAGDVQDFIQVREAQIPIIGAATGSLTLLEMSEE